jgi:hypothetical protein
MLRCARGFGPGPALLHAVSDLLRNESQSCCPAYAVDPDSRFESLWEFPVTSNLVLSRSSP